MPTVPPAGGRRQSYYYGAFGHRYTIATHDENPVEAAGVAEADRFPPVVRIRAGQPDCPLFLFFTGEGRELDAGDSYQQRVAGQNPGSVAGYAWSGGGGGSTKTYNFGSPGLQAISCTVTDGNGVQTTGRRWARVHDRAGANAPVPILHWDGFDCELADRAHGGARIRVTVPSSYRNSVQAAMAFTLYKEDYLDGVRTAEGEVFSGFVELAEVEYRTPNRPFVFVASTPERSLLGGDGPGTLIHTFEDFASAEDLGGTEPGGQPLEEPGAGIAAQSPWHVMDPLTLPKIVMHLASWHLAAEVDGTERRLIDVIGFRCPWWNLGSDTDFTIDAAEINEGNLLREIENVGFQIVHRGYFSRTSEWTYTVIHPAAITLDAIVADIDVNACDKVMLIDADGNVVKQVILEQLPAAQAALADPGLTAAYPASPNSRGKLIRPAIGFMLGSQAALDKVARAVYDDARSVKGAEIELSGSTFDIFNLARLTVGGESLFPWTNKLFQVERAENYAITRRQGVHKQRLRLREVLIS